MNQQQIKLFNKAEQMLKKGIKDFKEKGEDELTATVLAHTALENLFDTLGLTYSFYKEVLEDLEKIYISEPVKTYEIYKKYGVYDEQEDK